MHRSPDETFCQELPCKPVALNATKTRGAFHPFEKEKRAEPELPASSTTAAASSAVVGDSCGDKATSDTEVAHEKIKDTNKDMEKDSKEGQSSQQQHNRKARRCWAPELHRRFLQALQQLGGSHGSFPFPDQTDYFWPAHNYYCTYIRVWLVQIN